MTTALKVLSPVLQEYDSGRRYKAVICPATFLAVAFTVQREKWTRSQGLPPGWLTNEETEAQEREATGGVPSPLPTEPETVCTHGLKQYENMKKNLKKLNVKCSVGFFS